MENQILKEYKKQEDRICLSYVLDKIEFSNDNETIEYTDFFDMYQISLVENFLRKIKFKNYILYGGYEESERKILIIYPEKYIKESSKEKYDEIFKIIRIKLNKEEFGKYSHRNYLGGIVKLGLKREKVGDILVTQEGADIITLDEFSEILKEQLSSLIRFENSTLDILKIEKLNIVEKEVEEVKIIVPSLRLDNIVSDLVKTSRSKAVQIINQERVFINGQNESKQSKNLKLNDVITIRGKGRFIIKELAGTTRSGRIIVVIEKWK